MNIRQLFTLKKVSFIVLGATLTFLTACNLSLPSTSLWFFSESAKDSDKWNASNFIYLEKDGTYTSNLGSYDWGKWQRTKDQIFFTSNRNERTTIKVNNETRQTLQLEYDNDLLNFVRLPASFKKSKNPFAVAYNKWRIRATKKENEQELKDRLINHCQFWQLYFTWGLEEDISFLEVRDIPTPIKIYGNGIALYRSYEVPKVWRSYFYDSTDSEIARTMLKEVMRKNDIRWPDTKNQFKLFLSAFEQIEYHLKK